MGGEGVGIIYLPKFQSVVKTENGNYLIIAIRRMEVFFY